MDALQEDWWTPERMAVRRWLENNAPILAPVYAAAVEFALNHSFPGRVWFLAHSVREIRNRLPHAVAKDTVTKRTQYRSLTDTVLRRWKDEGLPRDGILPVSKAEEAPASGPKRHDVSESLLQAVGELLVGHLAVPGRVKDNATRAFESILGGPAPDHIIARWLRATNTAEEIAHVRDEAPSPAYESDLVDAFLVVEKMLVTVSRRAYENMDDLDEVLDSANR